MIDLNHLAHEQNTGGEPIPPARLAAAAHLLRVLTHPDRLRICELLLHKRASVGELALHMQRKQNVVSQHLNQMRAYGIVAPERAGRTVYYRVTHPGPSWLLACIRAHDLPPADQS
ncbi:MAG: winged helix-turn-helix transcriptional regulator [Phycisphaerales bacterium]|nr:winged helix-turn-helix transcriptional regulator [Phycisphaerales bacterium]